MNRLTGLPHPLALVILVIASGGGGRSVRFF